MVLNFEKKFNRDLKKIRDKELLSKILPEIILNVKRADNIAEIDNLKQLESIRFVTE